MSDAIILYGPPAAGKDTVTHELAALDSRYTQFQRIKVGAGRTAGYRMMTDAALSRLSPDDVLYRNERYGATYVVDRPGLDSLTGRGELPVLHLGQVAGIQAVTGRYPADWLVVGLWCSRQESTARLAERQDARPAERLNVWDATRADWLAADPGTFTLTLNTEQVDAPTAAALIASLCRT